MTALVIRLAAPLMSWSGYRHQLNMGSLSPTAALPRKSGINGLIGAALGPRDAGFGSARNLDDVGKRYELHVRVDRRNPGTEDFQVISALPEAAAHNAERAHRIATATTKAFPTKRAGGNFPTAVARREFLSHAEFITVLETDAATANAWHEALRAPAFMPYFGRRSCAPTFPFVLGVSANEAAEVFATLPYVTDDPRQGRPMVLTGYTVVGDYDFHKATPHPGPGYCPPVAARKEQLQWIREAMK